MGSWTKPLQGTWAAVRKHPLIVGTFSFTGLIGLWDAFGGGVNQLTNWNVPTLATLLGPTIVSGAHLLPWWGWLMLLQAILTLGVILALRRNTAETAGALAKALDVDAINKRLSDTQDLLAKASDALDAQDVKMTDLISALTKEISGYAQSLEAMDKRVKAVEGTASKVEANLKKQAADAPVLATMEKARDHAEKSGKQLIAKQIGELQQDMEILRGTSGSLDKVREAIGSIEETVRQIAAPLVLGDAEKHARKTLETFRQRLAETTSISEPTDEASLQRLMESMGRTLHSAQLLHHDVSVCLGGNFSAPSLEGVINRLENYCGGRPISFGESGFHDVCLNGHQGLNEAEGALNQIRNRLNTDRASLEAFVRDKD